MEQIKESLCTRPAAKPQEILAEGLEGQSELQQLEILTEIFTAGAVTDERFAETIHAAWEHFRATCGRSSMSPWMNTDN
ncbi:uncharacterized protein LDX57_009534 [Aspergillus melleus]|uniref:uncharacterized protein n=1 Tax=Aspergillus melleus TaxID=138277 RepID=UPI001E8E10DB|nr:uncharacterized protein LDX57_009534 [Aspergillus melleus]KAH8431884.1 hypothetical protein LDX57_009534 [Aspergillus melleus]